MSEPSVFVVDEDTDIQRTVEFTVRSAGFTAVTFASAEAFLREYVSGTSGCLVLEVHLPGIDGLELQRRLLENDEPLRHVFLTHCDQVSICAQAMKAGAIDFLSKPLDRDRLLDALGRAFPLNAAADQRRRARSSYSRRSKLLTDREKEVCRLMIEGLHTKQIALELGISIKTVDNHRAKVLHKMRVENTIELVHLALAAEVIPPRVKGF